MAADRLPTLLDSSLMDVVPDDVTPTYHDDGRRIGWLFGRELRVSRENFEWMKAATPEELATLWVRKMSDLKPRLFGGDTNTRRDRDGDT